MAFYDTLAQGYSGVQSLLGNSGDQQDTEANVKPVTQTIKTDPITGEQTMTVKGSPQDLSAANPYTPTVLPPQGATPTVSSQPPVQAVPAVPEVAPAPIVQPQPVAQAPAPVNPAAAPVPAPVAPPIVPEPVRNVAAVGSNMGANEPSYGGGVVLPQDVANGGALGAPTQPVAPTPTPAPVPQAAPAPVNPAAVDAAPDAEPAPAPAAAPTIAPGSPEDHHARLQQAYNEPDPIKRQQQLADLLRDPTLSLENRKLVGDQLYQDMGNQRAQADAEKKLATATPSDLARYMKEKSGEGSYIKAILFGRLGLNALALEEQQKLGAGTKMMAEMDESGKRYSVMRDANGMIIKAFDVKGKEAGPEELDRLSALAIASKGMVTGQTMGKDSNGDVWSHSTTPGTNKIVWTNQSTSEQRMTAPKGYHSMGQQEAVTIDRNKALQVASTLEAKMRKDDADYFGQTGQHKYTPEDYAQGRNNVLTSHGLDPTTLEPMVPGSVSGATGGAAAPIVGTTPSGARVTAEQQELQDAGFPVISGVRTQAENDALKHHQVNGQWFTKEGNPVSDSSVHLTGNAVDMDNKKLTGSQRRDLVQRGWYQPIPQTDPNHWEKITLTAAGAVPGNIAGAATPTPSSPAAATAQGLEDRAQAIYKGEQPMPTSFGRQNAQNQAIAQRVQEIARERGVSFDPQKYKENTKIIADFTPGGVAGKSIVAMGTAVNHIGDFRPLVAKLPNGQYPAANYVANVFSKQFGHPEVTNIEAVGPAIAAEIQKTFVSGGPGTGTERAEVAHAFSAAKSPEQLAGAVKMYENLMVGKIDELSKQYARTGRTDFWTNVVRDPRIKEMVDRHQAERNAEKGSASGTATTGFTWKQE